MKELGVHVGHDIGARMLVQVTTILLRRDPLVKVRVWSLELVNGHQKAQISVHTEKNSWKTVQKRGTYSCLQQSFGTSWVVSNVLTFGYHPALKTETPPPPL